MRKRFFALLLAFVLLLTACKQAASYEQITQEEAKQIMDTTNGYILLDTRTQEEYDQSHIPGALLIPHTEIAERAAEVMLLHMEHSPGGYTDAADKFDI